MVLEGLRNDKQEKTREAGTKQRKTMSTIAKVNSCNAKNSLKEFKESASELETIDKKAVAFLWAMLGHHLKQKSSKKAKKNITDMQVVIRDVMNRRDIPTE